MYNRNKLKQYIIQACEQEVRAPKPGNVNIWRDGHHMKLQDFILSAHAIAPCLTEPEATVGTRILQAVKATQAAVQDNTNLGIILLFAPLCVAAARSTSFRQLRDNLSAILNQLTVEDARQAYTAICLAQAGGMGRIGEHDIHEPPTVTLKQAMSAAQDRDLIAAQYSNQYHHIFDLGFPTIQSAINCGESIEWAATLAYLCLLADNYDTLICRKHGQKAAEKVSEKARYFIKKMSENNSLKSMTSELSAWDKELKRQAINPGTTADLVAASLLVYALSSQ